jgi:formate hydrogenlyase transcriptional activator
VIYRYGAGGNYKTLNAVMSFHQNCFILSSRREGTSNMINVRDRELVGKSPKFLAALRQVETVAPASCAVLLHGETGTGKELFARAVHEQSSRSKGPFVKVNCAAIPAGLLESELFGHERGAFTGALNQTAGRFQLADRGTLFLDEIGDLPIELQPKLLRVLQEQEFERLGSSRTIRVDVRVVAATHQNLAQMVSEGRFRADLFYRLNVFPVSIPALRDRGDDIPMLVEHFVHDFAARDRKQIDEIPDEFLEALRFHDWPGNIRELQNLIERAVILTTGRVLHVPVMDIQRMVPAQSAMPPRTLAELERASITEALRRSNWVVGGNGGAAAQLGLPRTTLIARMRKHRITREAVSIDTGRSIRRDVPSEWSAAALSA